MEYIINPSKNGPHFRHPMPFHGVSRQGSSGKKPPSICLWSIHRTCGKYESLVDGVGKIGLGRVKTLKRRWTLFSYGRWLSRTAISIDCNQWGIG